MRRLVISDLHFGSAGALASLPLSLERLEPELAWAEELVIVGDLFALLAHSWEEALCAAGPFLDLVRSHVPSVVLVPGNHDSHVLVMEHDLRQREAALGLDPAPGLLDNIFPQARTRLAYPFVTLEGISYIHGHHLGVLSPETGVEILDTLILPWKARRAPHLSPADYEALLQPLLELARLASLHRPDEGARRHLEALRRWSHAASCAGGSPQGATVNLIARRLGGALSQRARRRPLSARLRLVAHVCADLGVPEGPVVYAHTHEAHGAMCVPGSQHVLHNSGSWHHSSALLRRGLDLGPAGTVLRACGGHLEHRHLLADMTARQLEGMLAEAAISPQVASAGAAGPQGRA
jgi:hypothetical protein